MREHDSLGRTRRRPGGVDERAAVVDGDAFHTVLKPGLRELLADLDQLVPRENVFLGENSVHERRKHRS